MTSPQRPTPSRTNTQTSSHSPSQPSGLRQARTVSSSSSRDSLSDHRSSRNGRDAPADRVRESHAGPSTASSRPANERTGLLRGILDFREHAHPGPCGHGTFSPRPQSPTASLRNDEDMPTEDESESSVPLLSDLVGAVKGGDDWKRRWARRMRSKKMSASSALAERAGYKDGPLTYLSYYIPFLTWTREYKLSYLKGDLIAAITLASFYLPMALSYADNLAHVPPINGLYSFVFNPFIYALLGSSPQMVVGPEAAGSLLVGSVVKSSVDSSPGSEDDGLLQARVAGVAGGMAGAVVFIAGLARLGFLDSVLSRPFLRGFISAIGFVIAVDQLIPELGLAKLAAQEHIAHGSSVDKLRFLFSHLDEVHGPTFAVAGVSFVIIMVLRELKRRLQPRYPNVAYIPDRFFVVVLSAFLAWKCEWDQMGVAILGEVKAASGQLFAFRWPFQAANMKVIQESMSTSFLIALFGFFESSVAAKSLGGQSAFPSIQLSPNRELVALGAANFIGGCFMSLPAFGGYGRSKVNQATGGKSPMSSVFLSIITVISILYILPYFYYLPKPVLSSMISVVAWSLIEECPHDISFFVRVRGWTELGLMLVIFLATIFYSLSLGIAIGIGLSLLQVIRHSTRPRIQILGRIPGTQRFDSAETNPDVLEFIEGCLIVKIPEPLTFANTGELRARLRRLELYGTGQAHPALPRLRREDSNRNVIFDIHGVTSLDGSGAQVLEEIVAGYRARGVRVFFSRGPRRDRRNRVWVLMQRSGIVDLVGGEDHFVDDVQDALKMTEAQAGGELEVAAPAGAEDGVVRGQLGAIGHAARAETL